jgi:trigger factor
MQQQGLNLQGMDVEKMLERLKPKAERRVRVRLIFDKIAAQENIAVAEADLDDGLARIAEQSRRPVPQVRQFYEENQLMAGLSRQLRDEKIMKLIVDSAQLAPGAASPGQETP